MYNFGDRVLHVLACLALVAGCGEDSSGGGDDAPPDDPSFPAPPDGEGLQLVSAVHVGPGEEQLACRYLVLPDAPLEIARFQHHYTPGSHHMLVYPTHLKPADVEPNVGFDCLSRGDLGATGVLYGASDPDGELPYPDGIGMKLPASSVVLLETHYLNPTDVPLDAEARVNLWFAPQPIAIEAGTLFFRDWAVLLPPAPAAASATMHCELPQDISLLYATSHMHRRGVAFHSQVMPPTGAAFALHDSDTWSAPTPTVYWPPLELTAGSTVEFGCDYRNDSASPVIEGTSGERDEMCVLVGGYWPKLSAEAELCLADGSGPVLDGARTCKQSVDCMVDAGVENWVGGQQCIADTCAGSAAALSSFVVCVNRFDCWGDAGCVAAHCEPQYTSCTQATCD
jgi:hypothetical protein